VGIAQASDVELLLHRVLRPEQADGAQARPLDRGARGVGDVQQGNRDRGFDLRGNLVHGVGAQHDEIGTGPLEGARRVTEKLSGVFPSAFALEGFDVVEVDAEEDDPRGVKAAEPGSHRFVDGLVIRHGGLPAHAPQQADDFHGSLVNPR
jgi:hypothetical protein